MTYDLFYFKKCIQELIAADTIAKEFECGLLLIEKYEALISMATKPQSLGEQKETKISGGIALSPTNALACLKDPLRTARFIKGVYFGITDLHKEYPHTKLNILYAGCGPVAPLIIPLLHLFSKEKLSIRLLDIHPKSMEIAKNLIQTLNASAFFADYIVADATLYSFPESIPLHCLISETMDKALTIEPQIEILKNLSHQIEPDGIQIPARIELQMTYSFFSKRAFFKTNQKTAPTTLPVNTAKNHPLFYVDKSNSNSLSTPYTSAKYERPGEIADVPDICILTRVVVYQDIVLEDAQSLITNPYCVTNFYTFPQNGFQLEYTIDPYPKWDMKKVN